jgi:arsenite-transporting ATPase
MERILDLSPPGLDEIMALARAMELVSEHRFEVFILDAAPTGHLIRLLELPGLIDQWLKAFFEVLLKYREVFRVPKLADRLVALSKELRAFRKLLADPASSAVYAVTIPTEMAIEETRDLEASCRRLGVSAPVLFVNQVTPPSGCPVCSERVREESRSRDALRAAFPEMRQSTVFRQTEPRGLERLAELGAALYRESDRS